MYQQKGGGNFEGGEYVNDWDLVCKNLFMKFKLQNYLVENMIKRINEKNNIFDPDPNFKHILRSRSRNYLQNHSQTRRQK